MFLRQSTASQEIKLGPFLDDTDGKTPEVGLTIANTDIKITKGGSTTEANKNSGGATHVASGRYSAVLDDTDTNTVGILEVDVHVAGALPVRRQYYVVEEAVFDALFSASSPAPAKAGDAMALTSGERVTFSGVLESAMLNDADGQALLAGMQAQVQALFDSGVDVPVATLVAAIRDGILNRVLSGNHDTSGTVGKVLQDIVSDTGELQTDFANGGRLDLLIDQAVAGAVLARQILGNKHTVVDNGNGTYTISIRNDDDTATVRTIVYNPTTGARTAS